MADLHMAHDYRDFLRSVFEERKQKNPLFSYRMWAKHLDLDAAQLFRILAKDLHLPIRHLETLIQNLRLSKADGEYFRTMVLWSRAKTDKEKKPLVIKLLGLRDVQRKTLSRDQYLFFEQWYHATIRCLVGADAWKGDANAMGKLVIPAIEAKLVRESLDLQVRLGLLEQNNGHLTLGDAHLSTHETEIHQAIRQYQAQMLVRAQESLERFSKEERDISSLTFAVDKDCAEDIKNLLQECRRQIQRRVDESGSPDRVMHLSLSLFPTAILQATEGR